MTRPERLAHLRRVLLPRLRIGVALPRCAVLGRCLGCSAVEAARLLRIVVDGAGMQAQMRWTPGDRAPRMVVISAPTCEPRAGS